MGVMCIDRNTTAMDILQVAMNYSFDLALRNVRGQIASMFFKGSVSASGTGRIRLESPRPAMPDTEPILTGMAPCPALHFSYKFPGSK